MSNPYNEVRYPTWPRLETHPDRLAAVATLFGMKPAPVDRCRVLELGASDGGNLIPMAYALPSSEFVGVDMAAAPVAAAKRSARAVGLKNLRMLRADLCRLPDDVGTFDYIIAHGVYSWVPAAVRDGLMQVCRDHLSPHGVAFVSYNVLPGRCLRQMLRDMMLYHTGGEQDVENAEQFLAFLRSAAMVTEPWRLLLENEIEGTLSRDSSSLYHDDLASENHAVYFHQFVEHARQFGLDYLGDAHVHEMIDHRGLLKALGSDRIAREQYLDFLKLRRFRQTLLCRAGVKLAKAPQAGAVAKLGFSSPARPEGDFIEGANHVRIRGGDGAVAEVAERLAAAWPRPAHFREAGEREILYNLCVGGFAEPHAWSFPAAEEVSARPMASKVARMEAALSNYVTNLCHRTLFVDAVMAALLPLVDGTRDHEQLARAWAESGGPKIRMARQRLPDALVWMAQMALLVE